MPLHKNSRRSHLGQLFAPPPAWAVMPRWSNALARLKLWRSVGVSLAPSTLVDHRAVVFAGRGGLVRLGENTCVMRHAQLLAHGGRIEVGADCTLNPFTYLSGVGGICLGDQVRVAPFAAIYSFNHRFERLDLPIMGQGLQRKEVVIGNDVWIGSHAVILAGVELGGGSVVAAGAVVTRSFGPGSVLAGVPAKVIGRR